MVRSEIMMEFNRFNRGLHQLMCEAVEHEAERQKLYTDHWDL